MEAVEFGGYIKAARKGKKMTIRQLELYSGVSNAYISQLERGERGVPSPDIIQKLSNALDIPYADLMEKAGYLNKEELLKSGIESGIIQLTFPPGMDKENIGYLALKELDENRDLVNVITKEQSEILVRHLYPHLSPGNINYLMRLQNEKENAGKILRAAELISDLSEEDKKEVLSYLEFKKSQAKRQ